MNYALAGFTIVCDITVILVPITSLLKLHMRPLEKCSALLLISPRTFHHALLYLTTFADQRHCVRWRQLD